MEYLNNQNYEMAITVFTESTDRLSELQQVELARAFYVNKNYQKCMQLLGSLPKSGEPRVKYESALLKAKCLHLMAQKEECIKELKNLQGHMNSDKSKYQEWHRDRVIEILDCFTKEAKINKAMTMSKADLQKFGKAFMDQLREQEAAYLMLGMPMFLLSETVCR